MQQQPAATSQALVVDGILPGRFLQAIRESTVSPFTCSQLHKLADQIASLHQLGIRLKTLRAASAHLGPRLPQERSHAQSLSAKAGKQATPAKRKATDRAQSAKPKASQQSTAPKRKKKNKIVPPVPEADLANAAIHARGFSGGIVRPAEKIVQGEEAASIVTEHATTPSDAADISDGDAGKAVP